MGTVLRADGYTVVIRTRDHNPPHVHVFCSGFEEEVVIELSPVAVRELRGMKMKHVVRAVEIVQDHVEYLLTLWEAIHD